MSLDPARTPESAAAPMSSRLAMRVTVAVGLAALVYFLAAPAEAHRLDEYLQATRLAVSPGVVDLELDLTPGASVASTVFAAIDRDADGQLSPVECSTYATLVVTEAALEADGRHAPLVLTNSECPSFRDMSGGVGTIRLTARAPVSNSSGRHALYFRNTHRADLGVYLVNALAPASDDVIITGQRRDEWQHELRLDYMVTGNAWALTWERLGWLSVATLLAGVLVYSRQRLPAGRRPVHL